MLDELIDNENNKFENQEVINQEVFIPPNLSENNENDNFIRLNISNSSLNEEKKMYHKDLILLMLSYTLIYFLPIFCLLINLLFLSFKVTTLSFEVVEALGAANLYINVFFISICFGINFPFDYFGGNAFGSNKLRVFGKIFLVSIIFTITISVVVIIPSYFVGTKLLNIFMSSADSKTNLEKYFYPALLAAFIQVNNIPNIKYLIIGRKLTFLIIINLIIITINVTSNAVFILILNLGLPGCAYANILTFLLQYLISTIYIFAVKPYTASIIGLTTKDCHYFSSYIISSIPSILLTFLMTIAYETISVFLLNKNEIEFSAFIIQNIISSSILIISISIESAMAVIISEFDPKMEKKLIFNKVLPFSFLINIVIILLICVVVVILSFTLSTFFNVIETVFNAYKGNMWFFISYTIIQSNVNIFHGCFRGIGKFLVPNIINICIICLINVPVAYVFIYILNMSLKGVWISFISCSGLNIIVLTISLIIFYNQLSQSDIKEE